VDSEVDLHMDTKTNAESTETDQADVPEPPERGVVSPRRRMIITIFVIITVGAVLAQNMPDSAIKAGLMDVARPYLKATGLDQSWSIFSPNPRRESAFVIARVERADGSIASRSVPTGIGPSQYWRYRWQKYEETLSEPGGRMLWRPYAEWVVDQDQREGGVPVRVTLVRRVSKIPPPGADTSALPFIDEDFYTAPVNAR
jgi:hypothetical protein